MPQLSLYLDDETMNYLREKARKESVSLSRCASNLIKADTNSRWPQDYWKLYGALDDATFAIPDELPYESDAPRGSFC